MSAKFLLRIEAPPGSEFIATVDAAMEWAVSTLDNDVDMVMNWSGRDVQFNPWYDMPSDVFNRWLATSKETV